MQLLFSAGLATQGLIPFCNIYSTFMQRAYDQVVHDVLPSESTRGTLPRSGGVLPEQMDQHIMGLTILPILDAFRI